MWDACGPAGAGSHFLLLKRVLAPTGWAPGSSSQPHRGYSQPTAGPDLHLVSSQRRRWELGASRVMGTDTHWAVPLLPPPPPGKWECPWHQCDECSSAAVSFCEFCPRSFCKDHDKGALVPSALEGRLCCSEHDPVSPVSPEYWSKIKCKLESQDPGEDVKE